MPPIEQTATRLPAIEGARVRGLRWLAESVLPPDHSGLDLPPSPVRVQLPCSPQVRDYVLRWARCPEAGGSFDVRTRRLRSLPDSLLLRALLGLGYSGLVYERRGAVIGHLFDQRHGDTMHAFSIAVNAPFEGNGYAQVISMDYLSYASQRHGVVAVRFGRGRNAFSRGILERLRGHEQRLGWRVGADGWVEFSRARRCGF
jgi:hypothetical protein